MPLFKVTRSLNHNLVTYEPNTIHEFKYSKQIQHLIDIGVLIPIDEKTKEKLEKISTDLDKNKPKKEEKIADTSPIDKTPETRFCPKCQIRVEVLKNRTRFYKSDKSDLIMKEEICPRCDHKFTLKASSEELKKIEEGLIQVQ